MCPIVLKPFPAVTDVGAISVEAVGEGRADLIWRLVAFIHIPTFGSTSFITIFTLAIEGTLVCVALGEWVADTTCIQAGVFTYACALVIHQVQDTRACVGTRGVAACHVPAAGCSQLTFIHILTDEAITLVSILALANVGPVCIVAQSLGTAVVWQGGVLLTFIHILAVKAIPLHARWARTVE